MQDYTKTKITGLATQTAIAKCLGVKPQTVSLWFQSGVPARKVIPFCKVLRWRVTPHQVNPEIYPNPMDGLPPALKFTTCGDQEVIYELMLRSPYLIRLPDEKS